MSKIVTVENSTRGKEIGRTTAPYSDGTNSTAAYNNRVLLIDDQPSQLKLSVINPSYLLGKQLEIQKDPECGIRVAGINKYPIIFIDQQFYHSDYDGMRIQSILNTQSPLSALVLITAYPIAEIENIGSAHFDYYFDKGETSKDPNLKIKECFEKATIARYQKIPSFDSIINTSDDDRSLKDLKTISKLTGILDGLEKLFNSKKNRVLSQEEIAKKLGYSREALSQKFKLRISNALPLSIERNALFFWNILMNNPSSWALAKQQYMPLRKLVEFFPL